LGEVGCLRGSAVGDDDVLAARHQVEGDLFTDVSQSDDCGFHERSLVRRSVRRCRLKISSLRSRECMIAPGSAAKAPQIENRFPAVWIIGRDDWRGDPQVGRSGNILGAICTANSLKTRTGRGTSRLLR